MRSDWLLRPRMICYCNGREERQTDNQLGGALLIPGLKLSRFIIYLYINYYIAHGVKSTVYSLQGGVTSTSYLLFISSSNRVLAINTLFCTLIPSTSSLLALED